jgi:hypothetical protein
VALLDEGVADCTRGMALTHPRRAERQQIGGVLEELTARQFAQLASQHQGLMTEEDFRAFVFTNPIKLHCGMNPDFFKGTVLEDSAAKVVAELIGPV